MIWAPAKNSRHWKRIASTRLVNDTVVTSVGRFVRGQRAAFLVNEFRVLKKQVSSVIDLEV